MICGIDEAGRGPVIGPLVIAGIKLKDEKKLVEINVRDSKKLTPKRREELSIKIKQIADEYEILIIPAEDIDAMRKIMTLNEIEVNAFRQVIKKLKPEICYVDSADVNEERFGREILVGIDFEVKIVSKHKADAIYPVVSAASILAKTTRDREIKKIEEELREKLDLPIGSGYPADQTTRRFLAEWYKNFGKLPPHTRKSWITTKNLINFNKKLNNF